MHGYLNEFACLGLQALQPTSKLPKATSKHPHSGLNSPNPKPPKVLHKRPQKSQTRKDLELPFPFWNNGTREGPKHHTKRWDQGWHVGPLIEVILMKRGAVHAAIPQNWGLWGALNELNEVMVFDFQLARVCVEFGGRRQGSFLVAQKGNVGGRERGWWGGFIKVSGKWVPQLKLMSGLKTWTSEPQMEKLKEQNLLQIKSSL